MTKVAILVLQETNTLSLAAASDPLRAANRHAGSLMFEWQFVTPNETAVTLTSGLLVPASPVHRIEGSDVIIVVAGFDAAAQTTPALQRSLQRLAQTDTIVMAIDGGAWVIAKAGLLDGYEATTHWEDLETLATQFPDVTLCNARYVVSGTRWTSGGAAPTLDMMLHLIEHLKGPALAAQVAASFIHTAQRAPTDPQIRHPAQIPHSPITARAHQLMEAHMATPLPIPEIARQLNRSPRSLQQHFQDMLGTSPKAHYLSLRLREAHRLLTHSQMELKDVALATGFNTQSSLSRAHTKAYGTGPRATRNRTSGGQNAIDTGTGTIGPAVPSPEGKAR